MAVVRQVLLVALFAAVVECDWKLFNDLKIPLPPRLSDLFHVFQGNPLPFGDNIFNTVTTSGKSRLNGFDGKVPDYFQRYHNPSSDDLRERFGLNKKPRKPYIFFDKKKNINVDTDNFGERFGLNKKLDKPTSIIFYTEKNDDPGPNDLRTMFELNEKPKKSDIYDNSDDRRACNCGNNAPENTNNQEGPGFTNFDGNIDGINNIDPY